MFIVHINSHTASCLPGQNCYTTFEAGLSSASYPYVESVLIHTGITVPSFGGEVVSYMLQTEATVPSFGGEVASQMLQTEAIIPSFGGEVVFQMFHTDNIIQAVVQRA